MQWHLTRVASLSGAAEVTDFDVDSGDDAPESICGPKDLQIEQWIDFLSNALPTPNLPAQPHDFWPASPSSSKIEDMDVYSTSINPSPMKTREVAISQSAEQEAIQTEQSTSMHPE